jgi:hypothetical protein
LYFFFEVRTKVAGRRRTKLPLGRKMTDIPHLPDDLIHGTSTTTTTGSTPRSMMNGTLPVIRGKAIPATAASTFLGHDDADQQQAQIRQLHMQQQQIIQQEESVLADILEELDRERHRRAEMEAKVRVLEEELHSERRKNNKNSSSNNKSSIRDYTRLQAERDGYKQIVEALTQDRPAFSTAMAQDDISSSKNKHSKKNNGNSNTRRQLPIHIVRLLEVMPWDPRAQSYVFGHEQVYEWQMLGADKQWKKELNHFPTLFKTLPIVVPTKGQTIQQKELMESSGFGGGGFVGNIAPPKHCVLTNLDASQLLNIDNGYPLPEDGGDWMWISNWKVEKTNDTDEQGWSYSNDYQIMASSTYYNEFTVPTKGQPAMARRRRKWMRRRMLINYPYASTMTQEYLKLLSQKAILDVTADKLSTQLVETKMGLTTIEADRFAFEETTNRRIRQLENNLQEKNRILGFVEHGAGLNLTGGVGGENSNNKKKNESKKPPDQFAEIGSAVTQWVSNVTHRKQDSHDTAMSTAAAAVSHNGLNDHSTTDREKITFPDQQQDEKDDESKNNNNNQSKSDPPTLRTPPHSPSMNPKQQLFDSLRGKGIPDFFEKIKQNAGQEIDKIKQGLGQHNNSSHDKKKPPATSIIDSSDKTSENGAAAGTNSGTTKTTTTTTTNTTRSNVYVPATKSKLKTSEYISNEDDT